MRTTQNTTKSAIAIALFATIMMTPSAYAQSPNCNPYTDDACADRLARQAGLLVPAARCKLAGDAIVCQETVTYTVIEPTVYKFGEGVVHAPGSELAWLILTNFDTVAQTAVVELLVSGRPTPITRIITLAPKERKDVELHELPELADLATFSTAVYFPLTTGHAALVLRPMLETFSRVTLPPPTVTTTKPVQ